MTMGSGLCICKRPRWNPRRQDAVEYLYVWDSTANKPTWNLVCDGCDGWIQPSKLRGIDITEG